MVFDVNWFSNEGTQDRSPAPVEENGSANNIRRENLICSIFDVLGQHWPFIIGYGCNFRRNLSFYRRFCIGQFLYAL